MSSFVYPDLSREDLLSVLQQLQIPVTENDFRNPNPEFFADLFTRILVRVGLLNDNGEDEGQLEFDAMEHLENPEHHADAISVMTLYTKIKTLASSIGCPTKFTLFDFLRPQTGRAERLLGAILNYYLHKEVKMERLGPLMDEVTYLEEQGAVSGAQIAELSEEIANIYAEREQEGPIVQELTAKLNELRMHVSTINTEQGKLRSSSQHLKEEATQKAEEIARAEFGLVQSLQENAILRSKIVQSPDKLQGSLKDKKAALQDVRDSERITKETFHLKTEQRKLHEKALKKLLKQHYLMQSMEDKEISAKAIEKELKTVKTKLIEEEAVSKTLSPKLTELKGKAQQLHEMKETLEKEMTQKQEEALAKLSSLKIEVEAQRCDLEAIQKTLEPLLSKADDIKAEETLLREEASAKVEKLIRQREVVVQAFCRYKNKLHAKKTMLTMVTGK